MLGVTLPGTTLHETGTNGMAKIETSTSDGALGSIFRNDLLCRAWIRLQGHLQEPSLGQ